MTDYISRQAAIDEVTGLCKECIEYPDGHCGSCLINTEGTTIRGAKKALENIPSADVVEVVRCKDCKHGSKYKPLKNHYECDIFNHYFMTEEYFCSYGEREEA